jgi:hypothetical protein
MPEPLPRPRKRDPEANRRHQRDHYWRRRNYLAVTPRGIEYDEGTIDMLVRTWLLDPADSDDPSAVWAAISLLVQDVAEGRGGSRLPTPRSCASVTRMR